MNTVYFIAPALPGYPGFLAAGRELFFMMSFSASVDNPVTRLKVSFGPQSS
jgi:hypothetical protein